ncbi:MAG: hypothetical protein HYS12_02455 [Planctomycetes bacterium]|nr:hypothetical protein [Planctomycetota bacterium]
MKFLFSLAVGAVLTAGIIIGGAFLLREVEARRQPKAKVDKAPLGKNEKRPLPRAEHFVTVQKLYEDFLRSPKQAANKYGACTVELTGRLRSEGKDKRGRFITFVLSAPAGDLPASETFEEYIARIPAASVNAFGILCYLESGSPELKPGQSVVLCGFCEGKPQDVVLSGCRVVRGR